MEIVNAPDKSVAIIGMPRSGSTIVASYINSLDDTFIIGEPFLAAYSPRPRGKNWPIIASTEYGEDMLIKANESPMANIVTFALKHDIGTFGFKECWTPWTDPIEIVRQHSPLIGLVLVVIREPRVNYMSMYERRPAGPPPFSVRKFNTEYIRLCNYALYSHNDVRPIFLDDFRQDPQAAVEKATGWWLRGEHAFSQFTGGGDENARVSKKVDAVETRKPYSGNDIIRSVKCYEGMRS